MKTSSEWRASISEGVRKAWERRKKSEGKPPIVHLKTSSGPSPCGLYGLSSVSTERALVTCKRCQREPQPPKHTRALIALRDQLSTEHAEAFAAQGGQRVSLEVLALRLEQIIVGHKHRLDALIEAP